MSPKTFERRGRSGETWRDWVGSLTPARVAVLVLAALALIFIFENTRETEIRLLIPLVTMPLWAALLITAAIGALFGAFFMSRRR